MDSVSQFALGAAVGVAVMGRRTALWKAAAWGAVAGTLPDLDVFIDHGDPIANMVLHRAETHAPFWLTLFSLPFAALVARLHGEWGQWKRWWLALWLALVTHPLLDALTVYGTQLFLPFTNHPVGLGSVFIIDPLYTLPLLVCTGIALARGSLRANTVGLVLSTAYLGWGAVVQQHVSSIAHAALAAQGIRAERVLVTPAPFTSVLWRVVAVDRASHYEGFYSLFDGARPMRFDRFDRGAALEAALGDAAPVRTIAAFSKGFYKLRLDGERIVLSDLRMGQEPGYAFSFAIGEQRGGPPRLVQPIEQVGGRGDPARLFAWLWPRLRGEDVAPPR